MAPKKTAAPAGETKEAKFIRLASARVSKAIAAIRNVGKLGTGQYARTTAQVKAITDALNVEVKTMGEQLAPSNKGEKKSAVVFQLS